MFIMRTKKGDKMTYLDSSKNFDDIISNGKVVVDFFAEWCGPCKMLGPVLEEVSKNNPDVKFLKVDTDEYEDIARRFGIMSIPCIKVFQDGKEVKSTVGFMDKKTLEDFIK